MKMIDPVHHNQRCTNCILPVEYPGVTFNTSGLCSMCENYQPQTYLGIDQLKKDIDKILTRYPKRKYDCVVGVSGGRDSTYILHLLKKVLKLNVLAFFVDNGYVPIHTRENVEYITRKLDVKLVINRHKKLERCFPLQFNAWMENPLPQTISTFCMGCKSSIIKSFYKYSIQYQTPLLVLGWTPFEGARYKMNLMKLDHSSNSIWSYIGGYIKEAISNPSLVLHARCAWMQLNEFMTFYGPYKTLLNMLYKKIELKPFHTYIRWIEKDVVKVIKDEYAWQNFLGTTSTWRGDCYIGPIRQKLYKSFLGYNDKTPHLSDLIRDGQVTRSEALERVQKEDDVPPEILQECCRKANIDYNLFSNIDMANRTNQRECF
jgi:hypothetical protein